MSDISRYAKRNSKGRYYTLGTEYLVKTYARIFKVAVECEKRDRRVSSACSIVQDDSN